ncbi:Nodulation protein S (NodS) [Klenkia marina]|uniref:Nodulation protein S (NodS) n=1 Tax=Klenkia marina TaxID=1960309 RepID=A0A1G4Y9K5_9ACTN|nr:SAM-dependent methyltransferase [Klenkia marina]SCX50141.1 Nodulation protein S (NodS) [Klenkia marina]
MTLPPTYFDDLYAAAEDPWSLRTRWYERRKYALTAGVLPRERYAEGLEVGCSVGELTAHLAPRCDRFTAWDASTAAVATAATRNPGVAVERRVVPVDRLPEVDLLVLSEVLYYLSPADLAALLDQVRTAVRPGGTLLAVHWRHPVADYPQTGDAVHAALRAALDWPRVAGHEEPDFLLECWVRGDNARAASVAAAEDLW